MKARREAIRAILERHGTDAVYVASTGFTSRAVFAEAGEEYCVFYMQGSMGLAPAIGLGMALRTSRDVVVVNGDASLLMSLARPIPSATTRHRSSSTTSSTTGVTSPSAANRRRISRRRIPV
jgi:thiamine pyrophosphate-dependent acetolactate synthase large subunit-like protein